MFSAMSPRFCNFPWFWNVRNVRGDVGFILLLFYLIPGRWHFGRVCSFRVAFGVLADGDFELYFGVGVLFVLLPVTGV